MVTSTGRPQESHHSVRTRRTLALGALAVAVVIAAASASVAVLGFDMGRDRESAGPPAGAVASPSESAPAAPGGTFGPGAPSRSTGVQQSPEPPRPREVRLSKEIVSVDLDTDRSPAGVGADLTFQPTHLQAWDRALQVRGTGPPVNPDSCQASPGTWLYVVDAGQLTRGLMLCVRTDQDRYGTLTVTDVVPGRDTPLESVSFIYTLLG
ncbi:hypothetical protein Val02_46850 [Virgisporangium aliadipatigenens]|uniref:Uncharacterized protein n=1 Tax=Virgisporangium aliadipatigenens TaxID=741659 RepID=A0A8J4DRL7_9ACTN|nr:hypothetical protein [Virgisporangium aliadipatigenens]GIJ47799.1 hypothetical protein Val02_46850 [Virgisporangium aliadipatigenens]